MVAMLFALIAVYLLIGLILALYGPIGKEISSELFTTDFVGLVQASIEERKPPRIRMFLFRCLLYSGAIVFWALFLPGILKKQALRRERSHLAGEGGAHSALEFPLMGGAGRIICHDCGYMKDIISFVHGDGCTAGYQCQSCGEFVEIDDIREDEIEAGCTCGGALSRNHKLFCPRCKSHNLRYLVKYIT